MERKPVDGWWAWGDTLCDSDDDCGGDDHDADDDDDADDDEDGDDHDDDDDNVHTLARFPEKSSSWLQQKLNTGVSMATITKQKRAYIAKYTSTHGHGN